MGFYKWVGWVIIVFYGYTGNAQTDYRPLEAKGEIPSDFLPIRSPADSLLEPTPFNGKRNQKFYERDTYFLKKLMRSGRILFGDTITRYLNEVGDVVLRSQPQLRKKLRFYAARFPTANAYCANNGVVLVNIGLLAEVETEAELAFILCHEIAHYTQKHPLQTYEYRTKSHHRHLLPEEVLLSQNLYSQQLEHAADSLGLQLFLATPYPPLAAVTALKYAQGDTDKDRHSRTQWLTKHIPQHSAKKTFALTAPALFPSIRKISQIECCLYALDDQNFEAAIFQAEELAKSEIYCQALLQKVRTYGWYALSKYASAGKFWEVHVDYQGQNGAFREFCLITEKMEGLAISLQALSMVHQSAQAYPTCLLYAKLEADVLNDIGKYHITTMDSATQTFELLGSTNLNEELLEIYGELHPHHLHTIMQGYRHAKIIPKENSTSIYKAQKQLALRGFQLDLDSIIFVEPTYERIDLRAGKYEEIEISSAMQIGLIQKIREYSTRLHLFVRVLHSSAWNTKQVNQFNTLTLLNEWMKEKGRNEGLNMFSFRHEEMIKIAENYQCPYFAWIGGVHVMKSRWRRSKILVSDFLYTPLSFVSTQYETLFYTSVYDIRTEQFLVLYPRYVRMRDNADVFHSVIYDILFQIKGKKK